MHTQTSVKSDDAIENVHKMVKCFGDVFDELVGKNNRTYKHRLHILNINRILKRYDQITSPDLRKR